MQRAGSCLRSTCRLCDSLRRPSISCANKSNNSLQPLIPGRIRHISNGRPVTTPLLDFLHPPLVRDAVEYSKRFNGQIRKYSNDQDDDDAFPSFRGWSASELERQDQSHKPDMTSEQALEHAAEEMFSEFNATVQRSHQRQFASTEVGEVVPHLSSYAAKKVTMNQDTEIVDSYNPSLTIERQSALSAFRQIIRDAMEGREQQAIDIYYNNDLEKVLNAIEKFTFATYLYRSQHRSHLEALLKLRFASRLVTPALCRLGRLDEARQNALDRLYEWNLGSEPVNEMRILEIHIVINEFALRGDWKNVIDLWENAVMAPTISNSSQIIIDQRKNVVLENCLVTIPNPTEWYIHKAAKIVSNPEASPKMLQFIKTLGAVLVKGFAKNREEGIALSLLRYQLETFREITQNSLFWEMYALRRSGRPKAAVELYLSYRNNEFTAIEHNNDYDAEKGKNIKLNIQNEAMASASLLNNFPILKQIFEDIYTLGLEPDKYSYAIVMHAFARHGQAHTVQELFQTYLKTGREPDIYMYAELLYVQVTLLDIPGVEKTFELIKASGLDPGYALYDMLTAAYSRTLDVDGAMRVFREYIKLGNSPDERIIGHLISMFANRNDTEAAVEMFNLFGEFGINPQVVAFNQLLNAYANTGDHLNAEAVIAKMREFGVKPDVITWTTLMKLYVQRNDNIAMVEVLGRMRKAGCQPNEVTWAQLLEAFARTGGPNAVANCRRVMNKIKEMGMKLDVFHWNAYLETTIISTQDLLKMQEVYDEMLDSGVKPNSATHGILVSAYCKYGGRSGLEIAEGIMTRLNSISQYLDLHFDKFSTNYLPPQLFTPIFNQQGPKLPLDQVQKVFDGYVNSASSVGGSPAEPDLNFLTSLLNVYRQHRDIEAVKRTWKAIKTHADNASRSFRSSGEETTTDFVVPGNRYLLCTPLSIYIRALSDFGEMDEIDAVWDQLSQNGYDFDCQSWNTRIKICLVRKKHIVWAFRACEEVLMDGFESRLRFARKKIRNPPQHVRAKLKKREDLKTLNQIFWPIEADLLDLPPVCHLRERPYRTTRILPLSIYVI